MGRVGCLTVEVGRKWRKMKQIKTFNQKVHNNQVPKSNYHKHILQHVHYTHNFIYESISINKFNLMHFADCCID